MTAPSQYGPVQLSLETRFGPGQTWWDGAQWHVVPSDPTVAANEFRKIVRSTKPRDAITRIRVTGALYQLGTAEARRGRDGKALQAFDQLVGGCAGFDEDRALRGYVAAALVAKGDLLARQAAAARGKDAARKLQLALTEYRAVIDRYGRDPDPGMAVWTAVALVASAAIHADGPVSNPGMAVVDCDAAIRRLATHSWPTAQGLAADAVLIAGRCRDRLGLAFDAVTATTDATQPATVLLTAEEYGAVQMSLDAHDGEGHHWWDGSQWQFLPDKDKAADKVLQKAVASAEQSSAPGRELVIAGALYQRGRTQARMGRTEKAIATYGEVARRYATSNDVALLGYVAAAHAGAAAVLTGMAPSGGRRTAALQRALAEHRAGIDSLATHPDAGLRLWAARALAGAGDASSDPAINDRAGAVVFYGAAARLLAQHASPLGRRVRALAMVRRGLELAHLGLTADAIAATDEVIRTCQHDLDAAVMATVATARANLDGWTRQPTAPVAEAAARKAQTTNPGQVMAAALGIALSVGAIIFAIELMSKSINDTNAGLNLGDSAGTGSTTGGGSGSNQGGGNPAPAGGTATTQCTESNVPGVPNAHHMVVTAGPGPCWAHEIIDLAPGCTFVSNRGLSSNAPANLWNIIEWVQVGGSYSFTTASGNSFTYTCVSNAAVYPQTVPYPVDSR